jgi:adenylate cyclase
MPLFRRSLELDASGAWPHAGIAMVRLCEAFFLWTEKPRDALAEAMTSARAALAADPLESLAYAALGFVLALTGKHDEALAMCSKGIELNPSYAFGYHVLCVTRMCLGEPEAAIKAIETAIRISPNDVVLPVWLSLLSAGHYLARNYEKAQRSRALPYSAARTIRLDGAAWPVRSVNSEGWTRRARRSSSSSRGRRASPRRRRVLGAFRDEAVFQHWLEGLRKAGWEG